MQFIPDPIFLLKLRAEFNQIYKLQITTEFNDYGNICQQIHKTLSTYGVQTLT